MAASVQSAVTSMEPSQQSVRIFGAVPPPASEPRRLLITSLLVCANTVQFISNFVTFAGGLALTKELGKENGSGHTNWMAASYPLTQGAFVLITGRLGAIYGHQRVVLLGCLIFAVFSLANAFCTSYDAFIAARALSGVGGGFFLPNAVSSITIMVPPGRSRNLFMGFFAASPPIGGVLGAVLAGAFIEGVGWNALSTAGIMGLLMYLGVADIPVDKNGRIDYVGAILGLASLLLLNIVCNQAPAVGWSTPYVIACLVVTAILFTGFIVWEKKFDEPIMPLHIFKAPTFSALISVTLLSYMGAGIDLWYAVAWLQQLRSVSVLQTGIHFIPFGCSALAAVFLAAWLISRVRAEFILAIGICMVVATSLLLATMPIQQTYWAQVFPAFLFAGFCPDLIFVAAQVIASGSVNRQQQGIASSLVGTLNLYGTSLGLGIGATIESEVIKIRDEASGFRAALYFAAGIAVVALAVDVTFVRVPKDRREGWESPVEEELQPVATVTAVEVIQSHQE
ncbi:hypothetical protein DHEL01_v213053 [Diaporthe helianthi]|uniref:Major facilitator superfamily (MFS) profile domain-containing protein n=1 Tax=Diaporthe helianthi TaxID=158607 RepID=A0A2P5HE67_DIAHE|nr:hypothetical protein DHEL01_v213053 [Diaporthe helianthi]